MCEERQIKGWKKYRGNNWNWNERRSEKILTAQNTVDEWVSARERMREREKERERKRVRERKRERRDREIELERNKKDKKR